MRLYVVSTGSKANAYILSADDGECVILDAGVAYKKVLPHIPDVHKVVACAVTHCHADHARAIKDFTLHGIPIITSKGTLDALGMNGKGYEELKPVKLNSFTIMPFAVQHDAAEPFGFLIRYNPTGETALYATDTYYLRYTFPNVNYWIIECNFCDSLIDGETDAALRNRLKESHMSLNRLCDTLKANDLSQTAKIVLVHLSDRRSDETRMVQTVNDLTGIETVAADNGMDIKLNLTPF